MRYGRFLFAAFVAIVFGALAVHAQTCSEAAPNSSGTHRFRRVGETLEISIKPVAAVVGSDSGDRRAVDCYPLSLDLRWANGRNNGSNLHILVLDSQNQSIFGREVSAFLVGMHHMPLTGIAAQQLFGRHLISVPAKIVVQARPPLALPASITYSISWLESQPRNGRSDATGYSAGESMERSDTRAPTQIEGTKGNEVVSLRSLVRLIGSSRLSLVQIELRSATPFPVREIPLKVRIGERVFTDELTGEHSGRILTLSLTPKMFTDLEDGAEIIAFYSEQESWSFGKLSKDRLAK